MLLCFYESKGIIHHEFDFILLMWFTVGLVKINYYNCLLFFSFQLEKPVELISHIVSEVDKTHKQISRYVMRLLPIEVTCKAYLDDIKKECEKLFEKHFKCEPTTYGISYK